MNMFELLCSCCGNKEHIWYTASNVNAAVASGWSSYGSALYCPECSSAWRKRNEETRKLRNDRHTIKLIDELAERQEPKMVTEVCPHCGHEVYMEWSTAANGYKAFCPYCGNKLMLCDECLHRSGWLCMDCDFDSKTEECRFCRIY